MGLFALLAPLLALILAGGAQAAPVNDDFASGTPVGGLNGIETGSTSTASDEAGEPNHAGAWGGYSVWFHWTAPQTGRWRFTTAGSAFDTTLAVYTGAAVSALSEVVSNDDASGSTLQSEVEFLAQAGMVYAVAVDGYHAARGSYRLEWQALLPANDDFGDASSISGIFGFREDFNTGATAEGGEPHAGNSIWYRWTAPGNMQAEFTTEGSEIDTFLCAYSGNSLGSLTEITCNDNDGGLLTSRLSFAAVSGAVYRIQVTGVGAAAGGTTLHWSPEGVTPARLLPDLSIMASQTHGYLYGWSIDQNEIPGRTLLRVSSATPNTGAGVLELHGTNFSPLVVQRVYSEDGSYDDQPAGSFTFHPSHGHLHFDDWVQLHLREVLPGDGVGDIVVSGNKTSFAIIDLEPHDLGLPGAPTSSVYGGGLTQGISVGWRDVYTKSLPDQWIDVTAVPPGQYWLEGVVDPENHVEESDETNNANRILITYAGASPPNNHFSNATVLSGTAAGTTGKNHLATMESGEPVHAGVAGGRSVWYRWTAPSSGPVTVSTEGSDFDTLLAVYTGSLLSSLLPVASNDDVDMSDVTSRVTFAAVSGMVYRIAVDGKAGAEGSLELAINPAGNDFFSAPRLLSGTSGSVTGSSHGATMEAGEPAHAGTGGKSVWFQWTAPAAGEASFDTEDSAFDTVLGVYTDTGGGVGALTPVASDDNSGLGETSRVVFTAVPGTTYHIALDGYAAAAGIHTLSWIVSSSTMPYILTHPESTNLLLGDTAVLSVVAGGSQPLSYQWWHNESMVVDGPRISGANSPELEVYKLQATDSGSYYVVVSNALGTVWSENAVLIALANPRVIHTDEVTGDIDGVLRLPVGIQSQGDEHSIQCTVKLDPSIFSAPRAYLGPDALGGTISLDLSEAASGHIGILVELPGSDELLSGHREIAVIEADISSSALAGQVFPAGFVSTPLPALALNTGGANLPAGTAAGDVELLEVVAETFMEWQEDGSMRVILRGIRGREYSVARSLGLSGWTAFGQGFTDEDGFVEADDSGAGESDRQFYQWTLLPR